ncbi:MAG: AMP-binding protein [Anaerolineales bacterium]|nr:AMP-binding protein [Anaerolineales bacterium]
MTQFQSLVTMLQQQVQQLGDDHLFTFLVDGDKDERHLTYAQLDHRARAVAAELQTRVAPGARVLLLYPPGLDYICGFFGCLYAGAIAVPAYPPDPARLAQTLPRLQAIAADAQASLVLTTAAIQRMASVLLAQAPDLAGLPWLATDTLPAETAVSFQPASHTPDTIAFLQYTSGSTRAPRGVILTHANLLHNLRHIAAHMATSDASVGVIWLPPYHDMGLIGGILQPVYRGFPCVLLSPVSFLQRPLRWLHAISRYGGTISGGPNFAYDLCARKFDADRDGAALDLSTWRVAFNGAETVRAATLARFADTFAPYGFRRHAFFPCYGLAEATLIAAGGDVAAEPETLPLDPARLAQHVAAPPAGDVADAVTLVGNGRSLADQTLQIVDPTTRQPLPAEQVGEIWLAGPSVAQGYWQQPAETAATFAARLAGAAAGPFLRTGDLGFLHDGQLYVTGRRKDLMIVHGQNIYPQDIELTVEQCHPALRPGCGAAFSIDLDGAERLVVVQEAATDTLPDASDLLPHIRQTVTEAHGIPVYAVVLIKPRTIFKTSSGKIQRFACREAFLDGSLAVIVESRQELAAPDAAEADNMLRDLLLAEEPYRRRPLLMAYLRRQIGAVLEMDPAVLDPYRPLSALGITSVQAVELSQRFQHSVGVPLPATLAYEHPTMAALADYLLHNVLALPAPAAVDSAQTWLDDVTHMTEQDAEAALLAELLQAGY